jgi:hypothetical protein
MHTERADGSRENGQRASYNNTSQEGLRCEGRHISPLGESALSYGIWTSVFAHPDAVTSQVISSIKATRVYIAGYNSNKEACNGSLAKE